MFCTEYIKLQPLLGLHTKTLLPFLQHYKMELLYTNIDWGFEIGPFDFRKHSKSGLLKIRFPMIWFLKGPDYLKTTYLIGFLIGFQMVFDKMAAFVWIPNGQASGFHSDPIQNPDHLQTGLFLSIRNPNASKFQIPTTEG